MKKGNWKNCSCTGREAPCLVHDMEAHWRSEQIRASVGVLSAGCIEGDRSALHQLL